MQSIPPRYETLKRLGQGGGGEVWAVRDRVSGETLAFKVLASDAGEGEVMALVREAMALSGLEGLGVPRVIAFGALADSGRRYMLRELVEGQSLESVLDTPNGLPWLEPLARASEQLTVLHRAGLLHGDIKPANVIVGSGGKATLVDLGLAAPWREGGTTPQGLTPRYAAPELFAGEPLTVRAEVYALGATLSDGLDRRGGELPTPTFASLTKIAARATQESPAARYPSVDEVASALRRAAGLSPSAIRNEAAWPVLGLEVTAQSLVAYALALEPAEVLAVIGPPGSGRTTLARRVAWTLGVEGRALAMIEAPRGGLSSREAVELELGPEPVSDETRAESRQGKASKMKGLIVIVDDAASLDDASALRIREASNHGARIVAIGTREAVMRLAAGRVRTFDVPPLDARSTEELLARSMPSLSDGLRAHLVAKSEGRPGPLRSFIKRLGDRAFVSAEEIDSILAERPGSIAPPSSMNREESLRGVERSLDTGRFDDASTQLDQLGEPKGPEETVRVAIARGRVAIGRGDGKEAIRVLDAVAELAAQGPLKRAWEVARARASLRAGNYADASLYASRVTDAKADDSLACEAFSALGLARVYNGDDTAGQSTLDRAAQVATGLAQPRVMAVALCSLGIAHQRAGRAKEARTTYDAALVAAEEARDAATYATIRLNLSNLAQMEGDYAAALTHLEAAADMGKRTGALVAVQLALLNLANLDMYLGRYARAGASIDSLAAHREALGPTTRPWLLGLEAELATRTGELQVGAELYEQSAFAWEAQNRPMDAAEARLEGLLARTRALVTTSQTTHSASSAGALRESAGALARDFEAVRAKLGDAGFVEHEALAGIVKGAIAVLAGDEAAARVALDSALAHAEKTGRREWAWRALDARAKLAASQGNVALAGRDTDAALAMLEETAAKLPRDLREVFWDDPRRRALRQAHFATVPFSAIAGTGRPPSRAPGSWEGHTRVPGSNGPGSTAPGSNATPAETHPTAMSGSLTANVRGNADTILGATRPAEDRLARIFEITRELASEHDLARLLPKVTDHAIALLGAERGFVVLVNEQGELETHTARDRKGDDPHANFSRSVAEKVIESGEAVIATSARDDARLAQAVSVHQLMIQSIACVPIRGAPPVGRTIGALYLETRLRPGKRFEGELPTLAAFADQVAIAIENARLVGENQRRAEELARTNAELAAAHEKLSEILGRRTEQLAHVRRDLKQVRAELRGHFGYSGLVGTSAPMRKLYSLIDRIKDTDVPVLVTGESGTGKEVVARAVHAAGPRTKKPFVGVNCGAIPANLLESELFGNVKGAFTGADRDRKGLFREAEGGSILLDEIGEMPIKMQAGLLRTLQEKTVRPVGAAMEEPVDTRVIAATNRDLSQMVEEGTFREDLFYRLNVIELHVPPLRERAEDIPPLIDHFVTLFTARYRRERKSVEREALRALCAFDWPGNVRQLEHVLLNAWLMSESTEIVLDDLQLPHTAPRGGHVSEKTGVRARPASAARDFAGAPPRARNEAEFKDGERERILGALGACNWNRVQAAKMMGVPRRTFYRRLKEYGIL